MRFLIDSYFFLTEAAHSDDAQSVLTVDAIAGNSSESIVFNAYHVTSI